MSSLSDLRNDGERISPDPGPELRQFDAAGSGDDGCDGCDDLDDTVLAPLAPLSPEENPDFDPDPAAPASAAVALTIDAPRGLLPEVIGWTVYAVVEEADAEEESGRVVVGGQALSRKYPNVATAKALAVFHADSPNAIEVRATAVVVNDQRGNEWFRVPLARAA